MIYRNNEDIKLEMKKVLADERLSFSDIAIKLNESRQQVNNYFLKKNFSFSDLKRMTDAFGYDIDIRLIKKKSEK